MGKTFGHGLARKDFRSAYNTADVKRSSRSDKKHRLDRKRKRKLLKRPEFSEKLKPSTRDEYMFMYMYRFVLSYYMDLLEITATEVEFLLFMHRFEYFESAAVLQYFMTSENQKKKMFNRMVKKGLVSVAAGAIRNSSDEALKEKFGANVYSLSRKGRRMCTDFYAYLFQEKRLPEYY